MSLDSIPMKDRPLCNHCGARLKPHYDTEIERGAGGMKTRRMRPADMLGYSSYADADENEALLMDPDADPGYEGEDRQPFFSDGRWHVRYRADRIVSRKFLNRFGLKERFCNNQCAIAYATQKAKIIYT